MLGEGRARTPSSPSPASGSAHTCAACAAAPSGPAFPPLVLFPAPKHSLLAIEPIGTELVWGNNLTNMLGDSGRGPGTCPRGYRTK